MEVENIGGRREGRCGDDTAMVDMRTKKCHEIGMRIRGQEKRRKNKRPFHSSHKASGELRRVWEPVLVPAAGWGRTVDLTRSVDWFLCRKMRAATSWDIERVRTRFGSPGGVEGKEEMDGSDASDEQSDWDTIDSASNSRGEWCSASTSMSISFDSAAGVLVGVGRSSPWYPWLIRYSRRRLTRRRSCASHDIFIFLPSSNSSARSGSGPKKYTPRSTKFRSMLLCIIERNRRSARRRLLLLLVSFFVAAGFMMEEWCTINWDIRTFDRRRRCSACEVRGRNWYERVDDDAIEWLERNSARESDSLTDSEEDGNGIMLMCCDWWGKSREDGDDETMSLQVFIHDALTFASEMVKVGEDFRDHEREERGCLVLRSFGLELELEFVESERGARYGRVEDIIMEYNWSILQVVANGGRRDSQLS